MEDIKDILSKSDCSTSSSFKLDADQSLGASSCSSTSSPPPSPIEEIIESEKEEIDTLSKFIPITDEKTRYNQENEEGKMKLKLLMKENLTGRNGDGGIYENGINGTAKPIIPEAILNEVQLSLRSSNSSKKDHFVNVVKENNKNNENKLLTGENKCTSECCYIQQSNKNNKKDLSEINGENNRNHRDFDEDHNENNISNSNTSTLQFNNQVNMLERILYPECHSHSKGSTPRITITIDPSMVFDECEEENFETDSDDDDNRDADDEEGRNCDMTGDDDYHAHSDEDSSVFLELASETGLSEKTLLDGLESDECGSGNREDIDAGENYNNSENDDNGNDRSNTVTGTITIDENGLIITCEKYGRVPIVIKDGDELLQLPPPLPPSSSRRSPSSDFDSDNGSGGATCSSSSDDSSNANHKVIINEDQEEDEEPTSPTSHSCDHNTDGESKCISTIAEHIRQQHEEHQSSADAPADSMESPRNHKLGRTSSTPSNTNLSEPSSESGECALKIGEAKPRRRNTIADIFRWLIESDSKSCNSLPGAANNSTHSRKSSDTSELSLGQSSDKGNGSEQETEEDLWVTWGRIVNEWDTYWKKKNQFVRDLVKRGIPHHFRGIVWQLLCGAHDSPDKAKYADYIKATSACEKVIRRDIARTYPEHDFFKEKDGLGQESLFNVMKAYSLHDREVGYCQGSAFIVGLLLMQMPEEEAFAVLVKLMQDYRLREMFKPSMAELGLCMYQLEMCVQEQYPDLHVHFTSQGFHTSMYASSWFLTIFTTSLPLGVASRIMDAFLMDGIEVVFRIALAILSMAKNELLSLDMEGMLKHLQKELPPQIEGDPENLFSAAFNVKYNAKKMKKLEKDYAAMKTKEQEEMVELRRLRTENKLLKQRIEVLESESSELANKLIQGQVGRAEEVETTFALKRELAAVRQHYLEAMKQLENVTQQYQHLLLVLDETNSTKQTSMDEISLKSELLKQKEELIQCLQNELVEVRLQEAENAVIMSDLRSRIQELEEEKKELRASAVDNSVAHLQEELIAVKLREAEASLSLKDLRQKVADLTTQWQAHLREHEDANTEKKGTATPLGNLFTSSRQEVQRLEEEVMTLKLREMHTIIELKEHRLKIMELETQVQVTTNQLKRQEDERQRLKEELDSSFTQSKDLQSKLKDERRRYSDLESKLKEDSVHARIKDAEKSQRMFDLSQVISSLQLKNQELMAEKEMMSGRCVSSSSESNGDKLDSEAETQERIKELQDTIATLTIQLDSLKEQSQQNNQTSNNNSSSSAASANNTANTTTTPSTNGIGSNNNDNSSNGSNASNSNSSNSGSSNKESSPAASSPSAMVNGGVESEP